MSIDATTIASFAFIGNFEYNEDMTSIDTSDEFPDPHDLELRATVYFPADSPGATMPSKISSTKQRYPLVVVHGNSTSLVSYKGYNYLLEHGSQWNDSCIYSCLSRSKGNFSCQGIV